MDDPGRLHVLTVTVMTNVNDNVNVLDSAHPPPPDDVTPLILTLSLLRNQNWDVTSTAALSPVPLARVSPLTVTDSKTKSNSSQWHWQCV